MEENKQIIEVEYDEKLVEEYKNNYIMEEEGIGAEMGEVYDPQTKLNTDSLEELMDMNEVTIDSIEYVEEEVKEGE